jgi:peptide/nickel transport system permease protein
LQVALSVVAVAGVLGTLVGTLAAYRGGWVDRLLTAVVDVFMAFPGLLLAIALAGVLGPGLDNLVIALAAVGWVGYARLARAQALSLRHREHVLAAVALGSGTARIVVRHLLPLMAGPLVVEATFGLASAVVAEAGLSFLGIGVQPPDASWGTMIREGVRYVLVAPHLVLAPGLALSAVVLAVNLAGDWLRDRIDVRAAAATARRRT